MTASGPIRTGRIRNYGVPPTAPRDTSRRSRLGWSLVIDAGSTYEGMCTCSCGAERREGSAQDCHPGRHPGRHRTSTGMLALMPLSRGPYHATTAARPGPTAVTVPDLSTVATAASDDSNVTRDDSVTSTTSPSPKSPKSSIRPSPFFSM